MVDLPVKREFLIYSHGADIKNFYSFDKVTLGQGSFGFVKAATRLEDSRKTAIKVIPKKKIKRLELLTREIEIMKQLSHPNIIQLYETFEDQQYIYLAMEICEGGELFDKIIEVDHFSEHSACGLFQQIIAPVAYLHKKKIIHRDLKPENFLFKKRSPDSSLALIDFGLAKVVNPVNHLNTKTGSSYYVAPEVFTGEYDEKCDMWSLGVILYMILSGYPPFDGETEKDVVDAAQNSSVDFREPVWQTVSSAAKHLILQLINLDPVSRYSAEQVLQHPWVTGYVALNRSFLVIDTEKLIDYQKSIKLRRTVLNYIATQCTSDEISNMADLFLAIDKNRDGRLSLGEIELALENTNLPKSELEKIMQSIDLNRAGSIDFTEFIAVFMDKTTYLSHEKLWRAFKRFDISNTGRITAEELQVVLDQENIIKDRGVWREMVEEADIDQDGTIDFEEFVKMMEAGLSNRIF